MSLNVQNKGNVAINQNVTIKRHHLDRQRRRRRPTRRSSRSPSVLSIKAGATKAVPIKFTFPTTLAAGTYFLVATIDPANAIAGSDRGRRVQQHPEQRVVRHRLSRGRAPPRGTTTGHGHGPGEREFVRPAGFFREDLPAGGLAQYPPLPYNRLLLERN